MWKLVLVFCVCGAIADPSEYDYTRKPAVVPEYEPTKAPKHPVTPPHKSYPAHPAAEYGPYDEEPQPEPYQLEHASKYPPGTKYQYHVPKSYCNPKQKPVCAQNSSLSFCLDDVEYPHDDVHAALAESVLLARQYADMKDQSADDLVDGINQLKENSFDYSSYNGNQFDKGNWAGGEGYICPSKVAYARPLRAKNVEGEWRVIVNDPSHCTQTQRVEICLFEGAGCRTLAPCYGSRCVQKYVHHRMLSFDPCDPYKGLFIDIYKLPSACSCHVDTARH